MKNYLWMVLFLTACSANEEAKEATAVENPDQEKWIVYEGIVKSENGHDIKMELSLLQNSVGLESEYKTEEEYINTPDDRLLTNRKGKYSILYGSGSDMIITLEPGKGNSLGWQANRGYSIDPKLPTEKIMANAEVGKLSFRTGRNSDELILLDEDSNPISDDGRYTLNKRSILFTVEGFITINSPYTEFFEMNTRDTWSIAKTGSFNEVEKKYLELATEKFEGIYLKGVAYYTEGIDSTGSEVKNLAIKRIISMKAHQEYIRTRD